MSTSRIKTLLPSVLPILTALSLILSLALLFSLLGNQNRITKKLQQALGFSQTLNQLSSQLESANSASTFETDKLIVVGEEQSAPLRDASSGVLGLFTSNEVESASRVLNKEWTALKQELRSPNAEKIAQPIAQAPAATVERVVVSMPNVQPLANEFELIRTRVFEGTQSEPLRGLVTDTSLVWDRVASGDDIQSNVGLLQGLASDLVRMTKADTQNSLFGYSTTNQILSYAEQLSDVQIQRNVESVPAPVVTTSAMQSVAPSSNLALQRLDQVIRALNNYRDALNGAAGRSNGFMSFAIIGLFSSLLLSLLAAWYSLRLGRNVAAIAEVDTDQPDEDTNKLLRNIDAVASGDLRHPIHVPSHGPNKYIAQSVNRSAAVTKQMVKMTRGVAGRINKMVKEHDELSRSLAQRDIRRQSQTAELSDTVNQRSEFLTQQRGLLKNTSNLASNINAKSDAAETAMKEASASLASVSAQVEVSSERMQQFLHSASSVTEATQKLKQLAEQTRLQALNVSLKMTEPELAGSDDDYHSGSESVELFDEVHQLTAQLVQVAGDTDGLIATLKNNVVQTSEALKTSRLEINNGAQHTHNASRASKDLTQHTESLQSSVEQALENIKQQSSDLSLFAERVVSLDKTGNDYSDMTITMAQDIAELQSMAVKLEESVAGFKLRGEVTLE